MEEKNKIQWFEKLRLNSWEVEILIVGFVLVMLFNIPDTLNLELTKTLWALSAQELGDFITWIIRFITLGILSSIIHILIVSFSVYLGLRGFWVGILGLSSVYPKGINLKKLNFNTIFNKQISQYNFNDFIIKIDNICSSIFSFSFLISFSSVTSAIEAAIDVQNKLLEIREGQDDNSRLSVRIVITLGDVLHKDDDVFGESVNLISRIESITPPDEIYISESAFLTLRKKEINTEYVGEFDFKGCDENSKVYKIVLGRKLLALNNQFILFSDIAKFSSARDNYPLIEKIIDYSDIMFNNVEQEHNGIIRGIVGDAYLVTFNNIDHLLRE